MSSILKFLGLRPSMPPIAQSTVDNERLNLFKVATESLPTVKKTDTMRVDFIANNWSKKISLPLFEVAIIPQTGKQPLTVAGKTHLYAATQFYTTSQGERSDASFLTSARAQGAYSVEITASQQEDGSIPGIYTDLMLMRMEMDGASEAAIAERAVQNADYQQQLRTQLQEKSTVFSERICHLTEPTKVHIDVHDASPEHGFPVEHALITVVSAHTNTVIHQIALLLNQPRSQEADVMS